MIVSRRKKDIAARWVFTLISCVSILALGAILIFVFANGAAAFIFPTDKNIRIVAENTESLELNGVLYKTAGEFIVLPSDTHKLSVSLAHSGPAGLAAPLQEPEALRFEAELFPQETVPRRKLRFTSTGEGKAEYPEAYIFSVHYPARLPGLAPKVHVILPEPPYGVFSFLGGLNWRPTHEKTYGIFPMLLGTVLASLGAVLLGVPPAVLSSLFLSEFMAEKPAALIRGGIELLAGIPSVVYGFFGLMVVVPAVKKLFGVPSGNTLLSAIIILAVMILPTIIAISETSLRAVPRSFREASLALGASRMQTAVRVVLPHARSGVFAGVILGISRAAGETMAVILVAGNSPHLVTSPLDGVRTLTATIALEMGYAQGRHSEMLFSIGVTLFVLVFALNALILHMRRGELSHD